MRSEILQSHRASVILYPVYTDRLGHSQNKNPIFLYPVYTDRGENPIYLHPVYTDSLGNSQKKYPIFFQTRIRWGTLVRFEWHALAYQYMKKQWNFVFDKKPKL
jgi:hypothetical protein